jgi:hypothetical protein
MLKKIEIASKIILMKSIMRTNIKIYKDYYIFHDIYFN